MKFIRYFLLILIVAAQVAYLVYSYGERTKEIENAPHLVLKCKQYDPRDILRGDYFAISNSFLRLELDSPVWGKSLYWGNDFDQERVLNRTYLDEGKAVLDITPREKGADDAVDLLNTFIDGGKLAVFWKQGEDGIHNATRVEAPGTAEDTAAEGEIRTVMNVAFAEFAPQRVETDEEGKDETSEAEDGEAEENKEIHYTVTATFKFSGITHYDGLHFYIPDNMTPNDYEIPEDWKDKFSVVLVYREDGTVIPNMLCVDGQPYLNAVKALPRREGRSRYNTSLYRDSHSGEEVVVPVVVSEKAETAGEEKAEQTEEQTGQPAEEVKPEEPSEEVQPQPAEQPQAQVVEEPQPEVQPQVVEEPQPAEQPQAQVGEEPQPEVQPQPAEQPQPEAVEEPVPAPEAPAPEEDDEI